MSGTVLELERLAAEARLPFDVLPSYVAAQGPGVTIDNIREHIQIESLQAARNEILLTSLRIENSNFNNYHGAMVALESGANPNARTTRDGSTALHWATWSDLPHIVKVLLDHKADVTARNTCGQSVLDWAAMAGSVPCCKLLLDAGAALHGTCPRGYMPVHYAARYSKTAALDYLISEGADPNAVDNAGMTPLHHALEYNHFPVATLLLARGASAGSVDKEGRTPLHLGVKFDHREMMTDLVRFYNTGKYLNVRDAQNLTVPQAAHFHGQRWLGNYLSNRVSDTCLDRMYRRLMRDDKDKDASMWYIGRWLVLWLVIWQLHYFFSLRFAIGATVSETVVFMTMALAAVITWHVCHYSDPGTVLATPPPDRFPYLYPSAHALALTTSSSTSKTLIGGKSSTSSALSTSSSSSSAASSSSRMIMDIEMGRIRGSGDATSSSSNTSTSPSSSSAARMLLSPTSPDMGDRGRRSFENGLGDDDISSESKRDDTCADGLYAEMSVVNSACRTAGWNQPQQRASPDYTTSLPPPPSSSSSSSSSSGAPGLLRRLSSLLPSIFAPTGYTPLPSSSFSSNSNLTVFAGDYHLSGTPSFAYLTPEQRQGSLRPAISIIRAVDSTAAALQSAYASPGISLSSCCGKDASSCFSSSSCATPSKCGANGGSGCSSSSSSVSSGPSASSGLDQPLVPPAEELSGLRYHALLQLGVNSAHLVCLTCRVAKPYRSKHCKRCDKCIYRMDHHCPWVDACIGANNYRSFVLFICLGTILAWWYTAMTFTQVLITGGGDFLALAFGLHSCLMCIFVTVLFGSHVYLITINMSTQEHIVSDSTFTRGGPSLQNRFDYGPFRNWIAFFKGYASEPLRFPPVRISKFVAATLELEGGSARVSSTDSCFVTGAKVSDLVPSSSTARSTTAATTSASSSSSSSSSTTLGIPKESHDDGTGDTHTDSDHVDDSDNAATSVSREKSYQEGWSSRLKSKVAGAVRNGLGLMTGTGTGSSSSGIGKSETGSLLGSGRSSRSQQASDMDDVEMGVMHGGSILANDSRSKRGDGYDDDDVDDDDDERSRRDRDADEGFALSDSIHAFSKKDL